MPGKPKRRKGAVKITVGPDVGYRIKVLRDGRGWNQGQLALYSGLSRQWVSKMELGGVDNPQLDHIRRVARTLGVTIDQLVSGADPIAGATERVIVFGPEPQASMVRTLAESEPGLLTKLLALLPLLGGTDCEGPPRSAQQQLRRRHQRPTGEDATEGAGEGQPASA